MPTCQQSLKTRNQFSPVTLATVFCEYPRLNIPAVKLIQVRGVLGLCFAGTIMRLCLFWQTRVVLGGTPSYRQGDTARCCWGLLNSNVSRKETIGATTILRTKVVPYDCSSGGISYFKKRIPEELLGHYKFPRIVMCPRTMSQGVATIKLHGW